MDKTGIGGSNWEEAKAEGWEWKENHPNRSDGGDRRGPNGMDSYYARILRLEEEYGDKNVRTGNAAEDANGSPYPIGIPGYYGVYVRRET